MGNKPLKFCLQPGCNELVSGSRCKAHGGTAYASTAGMSSTALGYGYQWRKTRVTHLKAHPFCAVCGDPATHVDHILPKALGGTDDPSNLQSLCAHHHHVKTGHDAQRVRRARRRP
jgi:5-methylcytosine-specific restriction protein A